MLVNLLLLVVVSLSWAAGYLFVAAADHGLPPVTATAGMAAVGAMVMVPGVALGMRRPLVATLRRRPWVPVVMGLTAVAVPNLAVVGAERIVPADLAAVLGTTVPIATLLFTTFLTRETAPSPRRLAGVVVAVAGMAVFAGWRYVVAHGEELQGVMLMQAGGVVFALNGVFVGQQAEELDGSSLAAWSMVFGSLFLAAAAFLLESPHEVAASGSALAAVAAEGVLGMGAAYLAYFLLVARAGAWFASLYAFLVPPLGLLLVAAFAGGSLGGEHLAGIAILLAGLLLLTVRRGEARP